MRRATAGGSVYYDADCTFCATTARRFERVLARRRFALVPLQSPEAGATLRVGDDRRLDEMRVRLPDGRVFGGASAAAEIARRIWWAWPVWAVSRLPGALRLMDLGYRRIASRRACAGSACARKFEVRS
jgi:predicted DCC family thiol-disulfide oxidoreductase YuxK